MFWCLWFGFGLAVVGDDGGGGDGLVVVVDGGDGLAIVEL